MFFLLFYFSQIDMFHLDTRVVNLLIWYTFTENFLYFLFYKCILYDVFLHFRVYIDYWVVAVTEVNQVFQIEWECCNVFNYLKSRCLFPCY